MTTTQIFVPPALSELHGESKGDHRAAVAIATSSSGCRGAKASPKCREKAAPDRADDPFNQRSGRAKTTTKDITVGTCASDAKTLTDLERRLLKRDRQSTANAVVSLLVRCFLCALFFFAGCLVKFVQG